MPKPRVTAKINDLVERANRLLALPDQSQAFRLGVIAMLEPELMNANRYLGFRYQTSELVGEGQLREGHDDTRRRYF